MMVFGFLAFAFVRVRSGLLAYWAFMNAILGLVQLGLVEWV